MNETLNPDTSVLVALGPFQLNATILFTWLVMLGLSLFSYFVTRRLGEDTELSRLQNALEVLVTGIRDQISAISREEASPYMPFIGTLFLFVLTANVLAVVPGFRPPTGSLSTTTALALCVFLSVPFYGVTRRGLRAYFRQYVSPTPWMLPFNIVGELSRTLALAVRLYGNVMSGSVLAAVLLGLAPLFFPVVMQLLGMITGVIQAYIFAVLATVYIACAVAAHGESASTYSGRGSKQMDHIGE